MSISNDRLIERKSLTEICRTAERIISVYTLEKHVWADAGSATAQKRRKPELQTVREFQLDPVRPFLNDILRSIARQENSSGQGYWIQADFGAGKSHLLCLLAILALGDRKAWQLIDEKETRAGRGDRESLYQFWPGFDEKRANNRKGMLVVVKTLTGSGSGAIGLTDSTHSLTEYLLDAVKTQLQIETGKNLSLYPAELLIERFLEQDCPRYQNDLQNFLCDARFFVEAEFEQLDTFLNNIRDNRDPSYQRSCGNKLWRFYTEYLKVQPQLAAETEDILRHMIATVLAEGYRGILLVLDEVSLFLQNRTDKQRIEDEQTLVVLSQRLTKVYNLPIWTVCAAQQTMESKNGEPNNGLNYLIADDRLKLVNLLSEDNDYYAIALNRVREIISPAAIKDYYTYYQHSFSWPATMGAHEFAQFFPFHKPALSVLRQITRELATTRAAIHFMHQALQRQLKNRSKELIRLWELFDEEVNIEASPIELDTTLIDPMVAKDNTDNTIDTIYTIDTINTQQQRDSLEGMLAIKIKKEADYLAYQACRRRIESLTRGFLKVHRDKAIKTLHTLFLYQLANTHPTGLTPEDLANSILLPRSADADIEENHDHYETIAENLKKELSQIVASFDEQHKVSYRFDPIFTGIDPCAEFQQARAQVIGDAAMQQEAWLHLLALDEWPIRVQQVTIDLSQGIKSIFCEIARTIAPRQTHTVARAHDEEIELNWQGRQIFGRVGLRDLASVAQNSSRLPAIESDQTDADFAVYISTGVVNFEQVTEIINRHNDPRLLFWSPDELQADERELLCDFAAYRTLVADWQQQQTAAGSAMLNWVIDALRADLAKISRIVPNRYARGRMDALNNASMEFHLVGELINILSPPIDRILTGIYLSRQIKFDSPDIFKKEDGVRVINSFVKTGEIAKHSKSHQQIGAVENFGYGLGIIKKTAVRKLDITGNIFVEAIWHFIDDKLSDDKQSIEVETLYKNFTGIGGMKHYGLSRRMVQIYLLSLVREGRVRVLVSARSGLNCNQIDYTNLAEINFTAAILSSMIEVQKMDGDLNLAAIKRVRLTDFKPSRAIIKKEQVALLVKEFEEYLIAQFESDDDDKPVVIQIE